MENTMSTQESDHTDSDLRRMWAAWTVAGETTKTRTIKEIHAGVQRLADKLDERQGKGKKGWGLMRDVARLALKRISDDKLD
jgi:hypothetical protein